MWTFPGHIKLETSEEVTKPDEMNYMEMRKFMITNKVGGISMKLIPYKRNYIQNFKQVFTS